MEGNTSDRYNAEYQEEQVEKKKNKNGYANKNRKKTRSEKIEREGEFEYPDGDDIPLQRSRQVLQAPFQIIPVEE